MIVFVLLQSVPVILAVCLVGLVYLSWVEVKGEPEMTFQVKVWWCLLVLLFNVLGYLALRIYLVARRRRRGPQAAR